MKTKCLLLLSLLLFFCCADPGGDTPFEGFTFSFSNHTDIEYNATLYIGGLQNGNFIATDSIKILDLKTGSFHIHGSYFGDENRWKPSLDKIRALSSDNCYFKLKLTDIREEIIGIYNSSDFFSLDISDGKTNFIGNKGSIYIYIMIE